MVGHETYSVEEFEEVNGTKVARLRNPWGEGEWLGDWSNDRI